MFYVSYYVNIQIYVCFVFVAVRVKDGRLNFNYF